MCSTTVKTNLTGVVIHKVHCISRWYVALYFLFTSPFIVVNAVIAEAAYTSSKAFLPKLGDC